MTHSVARRLSYVVAYEKYGTAERAAKAKGTTARTIQRWVTRFAETGTVSDAPRSGRPRVKQIHSSRGRKILKKCVDEEMHAPRICRQLEYAGEPACIPGPFKGEDVASLHETHEAQVWKRMVLSARWGQSTHSKVYTQIPEGTTIPVNVPLACPVS